MTRVRLLAAGLLLAAMGVFAYATHASTIMPFRAATITDLRAGPGGWVACTDGAIPATAHRIDSRCYQAAVGDDLGLYAVARVADAVLGTLPPEEIAKGLGIGLLTAALLVLPALLYPLGGWPAVALSPLLLLADPLRSFDVYWASALAVAVGLPMLLLAVRRWSAPMVIGVLLLATAATAFRSGAGLPLIAGACIVALVHRRWAWLPVIAGALVLPNLLFPSHLMWHSVYIGLGFLDNPYGIEYLDASGFAVAAAATGSWEIGPASEAAMREAVSALARSDPWFVLRTIAVKGLVLTAISVVWLVLALALIPMASRRELAVGGVVIASAAVPGLAVMPRDIYALGLTTGLAVVTVVGLGRMTARWRGWPLPRPPREVGLQDGRPSA